MPTRRWRYEAEANTAWTLSRDWLAQTYRDTDSLRLLDVGAFDGVFLNSLAEKWSRFAVEPSADARTRLEAMGISVIDHWLKAPRSGDAETFDVVTLFDVFEHLRQPGRGLADAFAYVKPGGHLIVSTGNAEHWTFRWLRGEHWYFHALQHLTIGGGQFFRNWAEHHQGHIVYQARHPHIPARYSARCWRTMESLTWGGLRRPGYRIFSKLALRMAPLRHLRHRTTGPYAPELADHLCVIIRKESHS
ncbi:MAG: class I SAM-dependent methyltransferase [Planctomycetaceae bacterium]|nr:class I SAM-dependent methyltransferase [Planctomycetaceae bacterium]